MINYDGILFSYVTGVVFKRRSTAATKAEPFDEPSSERTKRCYNIKIKYIERFIRLKFTVLGTSRLKVRVRFCRNFS